MKQIRKMYLDSDKMNSWVNDTFHNLCEDSRMWFHTHSKKSGMTVCYVLNIHNGKSYRCTVLKHLKQYGLCVCYAMATSNKVAIEVEKVPMQVAFQYPTYIRRPLDFYLVKTEGAEVIRSKKGKWIEFTGEDAKKYSENILYHFGTNENSEWFIPVNHIYF